MTNRELQEKLKEFPDDVDVMFKDYGSDQGVYVEVGFIWMEYNPDNDYYNTILMVTNL